MRRFLPLIILSMVLGLLAVAVSTLLVDDSQGSLGVCPTPTGTSWSRPAPACEVRR